ncbi:hypothetical protein [Capnocytophaga gingivalis]|jgi:hypothetical protein
MEDKRIISFKGIITHKVDASQPSVGWDVSVSGRQNFPAGATSIVVKHKINDGGYDTLYQYCKCSFHTYVRLAFGHLHKQEG